MYNLTMIKLEWRSKSKFLKEKNKIINIDEIKGFRTVLFHH